MQQHYFMYITINPGKTMLYVGITNKLSRRTQEHFDNRGDRSTFAGKHYCYNVIYWETFERILDTIDREKEVKKRSRKKKKALINAFNPSWNAYNHWIFEKRIC